MAVPQKKVSIVLPNLRGGGAERVNVDLAKGFRDHGVKMEFVLRQARGELLEEASAIGEIYDLKAPRVRSSLKPLSAYFRNHRPDAVLVSMWPLTFVATWARRRSGHGCPMVLVEHGILSRQYEGRGFLHRQTLRRSLKFAAARANGCIGVSQGVADDLAQLTGLGQDRFSVVYNPVQPLLASNKEHRSHVEALWRGGKGKRILSVGRFKAVKNQALLIDAFVRLADPEARLMLVGDGELRADLERRALDKGVAERVIFPGFQTDLHAFYASADVFALSSKSEGFGNVIVEALSCGLPVVSTDCPTGPREILDGGRFGRLTEPGNAPQLAEELTNALASDTDKQVQQARAAEFAPSVAVEAYLKALFG